MLKATPLLPSQPATISYNPETDELSLNNWRIEGNPKSFSEIVMAISDYYQDLAISRFTGNTQDFPKIYAETIEQAINKDYRELR